MQSPETHSIELSVSEPEISIFNTKLNPHRTESLVHGYCNECKYFQIISIDIIKIIVLYFNHITYFNIKKGTVLYRLGKSPWRFDIYNMLSIYQFDLRYKLLLEKYYRDCMPPTTITTNETIDNIERFKDFKFEVILVFDGQNNISRIKLTPKYKMKDVREMVLRIRIFCVQNDKEIVQLIKFEFNILFKICKQLQITSDLFQVNKNEIDIGAEIEILHILYEDNSYWAKWHYSLVTDVAINRRCMVHYNEWRKYLDSRCFKINDKHFYLLDEHSYWKQVFDAGANAYSFSAMFYGSNLPEIIKFIGYFCQEILLLPYDIIIIDRNCLQFSVRDRFQNGLKKSLLSRKAYEIIRAQIEIDDDSRVSLYEKENKHARVDPKLFNTQRYKYQNKICKMHKSYSNNKKKFKYNRW